LKRITAKVKKTSRITAPKNVIENEINNSTANHLRAIEISASLR